MNTSLDAKQRNHAMTLLDGMIVLAVIALLAALLLPALSHAKAKAIRIACVSNLKETGLAFRIWSADHGGEFPQAVAETNGGSMEFATGPNVFRHFQVMSNELSTPSVVFCPSELDSIRGRATNFSYFANSNLSFFVGVDARKSNTNIILSGDRNITDGLPAKNGMLELIKNSPARWTSEMHNGVGNILLADGTVLMVGKSALSDVMADTGVATNRLQMPILGP